MTLLEKSFGRDRYFVKYLVDEEYHGMRLDQFMQNYLLSFSRQAIKEKIRQGDIKIEGRKFPHKSSVKVHHKDIITMITHRTSHEDEYWEGKLLELQEAPDIVHEDDDLLVISKPAFMSTHPTGKHLFNCATVFFESIYKKTIHSIHRLDRETSGILLLAKNPHAAQVMTDHFENNRVKKCYFFIAKVNEDFKDLYEFEAHERLGNDNEGLERVYINHYPKESDQGKRACTIFSIIHQEGEYVVGLAYPQTGRQHQIRVHAMIHGLPLVGDKLYLGNFKMFQRFKDNLATPEDHLLMEIPRHALHALALKLPYNDEQKIFKGIIPLDFQEWIAKSLKITSLEIEEKVWKQIDSRF